jgi:hypothetical protein
MSIKHIKKIDHERRQLILSSGEVVNLRFDEDLEAVYVHVEKNKVGELSFSPIEGAMEHYHAVPDYHLTHAFIEGGDGKYKHQGIGTEAFRLFRECTGAKVTFSEHDGIKKGDGSHLTGDAPKFVDKLKKLMNNGQI